MPRGERKKQIGYCVKYVEDDVTEWWKLQHLEKYFVHGEITAETNPDMKDLQMCDRVYAAWESRDEWHYGVIEKVLSCTSCLVMFVDMMHVFKWDCGIPSHMIMFLTHTQVHHHDDDDNSIKSYTVRFDDGTSDCNVSPEHM